ncbi:MAG: hypothetical protein AB7G11_13595, partial [Phycisphaerales bacterium]
MSTAHDRRITQWTRMRAAICFSIPAAAYCLSATVSLGQVVRAISVPATPVEEGGEMIDMGTAPEMQPGMAMPGVVMPGVVGAGGGPLSALQLEDAKAEFEAADDAGKTAIRAYFKDMGIDLERLMSGQAGADAAAAPMITTLLQAVQLQNFARTPQAVLSARSELGFGDIPQPAKTNFEGLAKWLQLHVVAGEWDTVATFLADLPKTDSAGIYAHILQSLNRPAPPQMGPNGQMIQPDPALLPEEVLLLADAAPGEILDYQFDIFSQLLRSAATKYSVEPMLTRIKAGTKIFGTADDRKREHTVKFLVAAGLVNEAAGYFPPLEEARARRDARVLMNHAIYHKDLAGGSRGGSPQENDQHRRTAWDLFREITLLSEADAKLRQDAMQFAIDLLPDMPPAQGTEWLNQVFANRTLGPAALEAITLKAVSLRNQGLDVGKRAQTILTMKEAIDTLLSQPGVDIRQMKIPLRMLTTSLIGEAEAALAESERPRQGWGFGAGATSVSRELELLFRALPDERWIEVLEPSVASRTYKTAIAVATGVDETDVGLDYMASAVKRFPADAIDFADDFLKRWERRMRPQASNYDDMPYFFYWRDSVPSAPLTRGRQRRNLDRLARLMNVLDSIGVESRRLPSVAAVFKACHGNTEVFTREGIEAVFGPVANLSPDTAASLAEQMRIGLTGDWSNRRAQQSAGMKRTPQEISAMVENGYALAIELVEHAMNQRQDSWQFAVTKAALTYDRLQYKQNQKKQDFQAYNQYRKEAFAAFAQTAERYAAVVRAGEQREDPTVFLAWFNAAVGSTELNYLTREDLLVEGSPQDDQIDLIRKAILALPEDAASRHISLFAHAMSDNLPRLDPEVKPRIVRHAMRIIGDHPSGAPLRRLSDLYQDLVKDEIKLRLTVDGPDQVTVGQRFGVTLTLRYSNSVDRETGGFAKYLQNDIWTRVGNNWRPMNYRDLFRKSIESALAEHFEVDAIGFFEPLTPARSITENGDDAWQEKPMAYIVLRAKDPSVDRLPQVEMDMHFDDNLGPVTLPIVSNSPPIDAAGKKDTGASRPLRKLEVTQTLDLRGMRSDKQKHTVLLEVHARGEGTIPELQTLLPDFKTALAGYEVKDDGVEVRPVAVLQDDGDWNQSFFSYRSAPKDQEKEYAKADEQGMYRMKTERTWLITYSPTGGSVGGEFRLASLGAGIGGPDGKDAKLVSRMFSDMDIVDVTAQTVAVHPSFWNTRNIVLACIVVLLGAGGLAALLLRRKPVESQDDGLHLPGRITPLSVITTLRRLQAEPAAAGAMDDAQRATLSAVIVQLERQYFGRGGS